MVEESKGGRFPGDAVIRHLPAGVLFVDERGQILLANAAAAAVFDRPVADLVERDIASVLLPLPVLQAQRLAAPAECAPCPGFAPGRRCSRQPRRDGTKGCITYSVSPFEGVAYGVRNLFAVTVEDVTEWKLLRDQRDRLLQLAAVGESLPTVLHEVKNPLAGILAAVELMVEETPDGKLRDDLFSVLGEVRRMTLAFEGIGAVGRSLRSARFEAIDEAARQAAVVLARRAAAVGVSVRFDAEHLPLLPFDAAVVRALVFNLVTNAIHATPKGGAIVLHLRLHGGRTLELTVVDTGAGMTAEVHRRCTELFYTTKRNGSGIGLALVRQTVEDAGGELKIESVPGFGTSVCVRVPLPSAAAEGALRGATSESR